MMFTGSPRENTFLTGRLSQVISPYLPVSPCISP